ncbi:MAG: ORF6N domain-containing protein [Phycisphaerales bacterium]|nr:ORF6N domain-containing protein [Planctomycetota bacterium]MBL6998140.1 ORF6N domain-containing protein [Phycisphaerales bacterium]
MDEKKKLSVLEPDLIERSIVLLRNKKVLLDEQLARFYGVEIRHLIQQVKRNPSRFPNDFMFQVTNEEWNSLKSQFVISKRTGRGGRRTPPYAFTELGVAMLSSVLRSAGAVEVNIEIMRAFVRLRQLLTEHKELAKQIMKLEQEMHEQGAETGKQIQKIFGLLQRLFNPPTPPNHPSKPKSKIGFRSSNT